jgi:hypothetical protein
MSSLEAVVSGAAETRDLAELTHMDLRLDRFPNLLVDPAPPLATAGRGVSLKRCKTFF